MCYFLEDSTSKKVLKYYLLMRCWTASDEVHVNAAHREMQPWQCHSQSVHLMVCTWLQFRKPCKSSADIHSSQHRQLVKYCTVYISSWSNPLLTTQLSSSPSLAAQFYHKLSSENTTTTCAVVWEYHHHMCRRLRKPPPHVLSSENTTATCAVVWEYHHHMCCRLRIPPPPPHVLSSENTTTTCAVVWEYHHHMCCCLRISPPHVLLPFSWWFSSVHNREKERGWVQMFRGDLKGTVSQVKSGIFVNTVECYI